MGKNKSFFKDKEFLIHKFGGTSVANAECFERVYSIVRDIQDEAPGQRLAVVVSAMGGKPKTTDLLYDLIQLAGKGDRKGWTACLGQIEDKHKAVTSSLLPVARAEKVLEGMQSDLRDIKDILRAVEIVKGFHKALENVIVGYGELWSAKILTEVFQSRGLDYCFVDARKVLVVEEDEDYSPQVQWNESADKLMSFMQTTAFAKHLVITGFIASTRDGVPTTLQRDGSDFSASIFGCLLRASSVSIWTDVSGILSADPSRVPEARALKHVSFEEAIELAYFGAKVLHPKSVRPAIEKQMPIYIRNTFLPSHPGTCITLGKELSAAARVGKVHNVRGFSTVDNLALFQLEGTGMVGVPGIASRLFGALEKVRVSVVLIAQGSSEHSICFAIPDKQAEIAKESIQSTFFREFHTGVMQKIDYLSPVSIIAAVGDNMRSVPGVSGRFFSALRHAGINVLAISQGSSERNISAVVNYHDSGRALRAIHSAFFLSNLTISVGVVGLRDDNSVGHELLAQIFAQDSYLSHSLGLDLRVRAVADSDKMCLSSYSTLEDVKTALSCSKAQNLNFEAFIEYLKADHLPHWLIVDCSQSQEIANFYPQWLKERIHVVSANTLAKGGCEALYQDILRTSMRTTGSILSEAVVGGSLTVIGMIRSLVETGDNILKVEACLSGSSSFALSELENSVAGKEGELNGMEPPTEGSGSKILLKLLRNVMKKTTLKSGDSVEDLIKELSGVTDARVGLIISRELGYEHLFEEIQTEGFLPILSRTQLDVLEKCVSEYGSMQEDMTSLMSRLDEHYSKLRSKCIHKAVEVEQRLRQVTSVDTLGNVRVQVTQLPRGHALFDLQGDEVAVAIYTERYGDRPLTLRGPDTRTATVTALFGDLLKVGKRLGARTKACKVLKRDSTVESIVSDEDPSKDVLSDFH